MAGEEEAQGTDVLELVGAWLDRASNPVSGQVSITITRKGFVADATQRVVGAKFEVTMTNVVARITAPAADDSGLILPPSGIAVPR